MVLFPTAAELGVFKVLAEEEEEKKRLLIR
jgi:hypothetical protein